MRIPTWLKEERSCTRWLLYGQGRARGRTTVGGWSRPGMAFVLVEGYGQTYAGQARPKPSFRAR